MAYADFTDKIVRKVGGRFKYTAAEDTKAGAVITYDGYLADAEDSKPAVFAALEDEAASGENWASVAVVIKKPPTEGAGGSWTRGDHGGTAGTVLYLDGDADEGKVCESAGTIAQVCGYVLSQDEVLLMPMQYLTGTNLSLSGTLGVTGATTLSSTLAVTGAATLSSTLAVTGAATLSSTLAVTGATTMTGALTANGGIAVAAEKTVGFTAKDYTADGAITPKGLATLSANAADLAMTLAAPTVGDILVIHDKANSGAKNHVVSAKAASATFDGTNNAATFDATNECLVLLGISTTRWAIVENIGSVGLSAT